MDNNGQTRILNDPSEKALNAYMRKVINNKTRPTILLNVSALEAGDASYMLEILKNGINV